VQRDVILPQGSAGRTGDSTKAPRLGYWWWMSLFRAVAVGLFAVVLSGCVASGTKIIGDKGPATSPQEVVIYGSLPPRFKKIAYVRAHVYFPLLWPDEAKTEAAIRSLVENSARLGANGLLIRNLHPAAPETFGLGYRAFRGAAGQYAFGHKATMHGVAIRTY
jgi:hypothetical protein